MGKLFTASTVFWSSVTFTFRKGFKIPGMSIVRGFVSADRIGFTLSLAAAMSAALVAPSAVRSAQRAVVIIKASEANAQLASLSAPAAAFEQRRDGPVFTGLTPASARIP